MATLLRPEDLIPAPWKNGGGVTREIARVDGPKGWLWRLSIAEVASDGPFSRFDGLSRILTVIDGAGIDLVTPDGTLTARPLVPVAFDGETEVMGRLTAGPIRDLNLIYDAERIAGSVEVLRGSRTATGLTAYLSLSGHVRADGQDTPVGSVALGREMHLELGAGAVGLLVSLGS